MKKCLNCKIELTSDKYIRSALREKSKTSRFIRCEDCGCVMIAKFNIRGSAIKELELTPTDMQDPDTQALVKEATRLFEKEGHKVGGVSTTPINDSTTEPEEEIDTELQDKIDQLEEDKKTLEAKIKTLEKENKKVQDKLLAEKEDEVKQLLEEVQDFRTQLNASVPPEEYSSLKTELASLEENYNTLLADKEILEEEHNKLIKEYKDSEKVALTHLRYIDILESTLEDFGVYPQLTEDGNVGTTYNYRDSDILDLAVCDGCTPTLNRVKAFAEGLLENIDTLIEENESLLQEQNKEKQLVFEEIEDHDGNANTDPIQDFSNTSVLEKGLYRLLKVLGKF